MANKVTLKEFNPYGVTGSGEESDMFYHDYITGPQGARFNLLREEHHTDEDVARAKRWLKNNMDVVKIYVFKEKT